MVPITGKDDEDQRLGECDDEKNLSVLEERRGDLEDVPHQNKWVDEECGHHTSYHWILLQTMMWKATGWVMEDPSVPELQHSTPYFPGEVRLGGGPGARRDDGGPLQVDKIETLVRVITTEASCGTRRCQEERRRND